MNISTGFHRSWTNTYFWLKHAFDANTGSFQCQATDQEDKEHNIRKQRRKVHHLAKLERHAWMHLLKKISNNGRQNQRHIKLPWQDCFPFPRHHNSEKITNLLRKVCPPGFSWSTPYKKKSWLHLWIDSTGSSNPVYTLAI